MRSHLHLGPDRAFDLVLAVAAAVVAVAVVVAGATPHAVVATAHAVASRMTWRTAYDIGLVLGLGAAMAITIAVALISMAVLASRGARGPGRGSRSS
ncbi:MAG TPA: hypothetical protein VEY67_04405 [Candidatus Dormibacteraeota bacterium]|nr:hypothetical protein [Candidatus Dormibacteraeota bacterium]